MKAYKIKDNKIVAIRILTGELQAGEIQGDFIRPSWDGTQLVETWTQADTDEQAIAKEKADKIAVFYNSHSTIWIGKTPDGTKDYAIVIGNDGKLLTIEII